MLGFDWLILHSKKEIHVPLCLGVLGVSWVIIHDVRSCISLAGVGMLGVNWLAYPILLLGSGFKFGKRQMLDSLMFVFSDFKAKC